MTPVEVLLGGRLFASGARFLDCPFSLEVDGRPVRIVDVITGHQLGDRIRPDGRGEFLAAVATTDIQIGEHRVVAVGPRRVKVRSNAFSVVERPALTDATDAVDDPFRRSDDFFRRRFGRLGYIPAGLREQQIKAVRKLRQEPAYKQGERGSDRDDSPWPDQQPPVSGVCNWTPLGPGPVMHVPGPGSPDPHASGRTLAVAVHPTIPSTVLIGAAAGGIWKTQNSGADWTPTGDFAISLAIGAIAFDPTMPSRVLAGTGEYHESTDGLGNYYGNGVLRSEDTGNTWTEHGTATFAHHEITRIVFDPTDATGQRVFLSASNGVFASADNGQSWTSMYAASASDLVAIPLLGAGDKLKLIAGIYGSGLWTSTRDAGIWSPWTQILDDLFPASVKRILLGQLASDRKHVWVLFTNGCFVRLVKTNNSGGNWTEVDVRLNTQVDGGTITDATTHNHSFTIPAADMTAAPTAHSYVTTSSGSPAHTHTASFTQDQFKGIAAGKIVLVTTSSASGHTHQAAGGTTRSTDYAAVLAIHPSDPQVLFLGEVHLWRNTSGGGVFNRVTDGEPTGPGIHVDQHALAFDPVTPDTVVWAVNDGGTYRSANLGGSWTDRNRGVQTLQYLGIASHPVYDAVMLGGTQDNGAHRYEGHPAWRYVDGGDAGFAAIDPAMPTRWYYGGTATTIRRSDSAGAPGTWILKNTGITGTAEFYPPFVLDPAISGVCYFGGAQLFRTANAGDLWTPITSTITDNITAIAVHPTDTTTIYVGTTGGRVYRAQRTGPTWTLANVQTTDLTAPSLPVGLYISDLAVDTFGTVYVTVASIDLTEPAGEFTNDHVFRRLSGGSAWEPRVGGLLQGNPINTIVIDPMNQTRLFVGADIGIFRSEDGGGIWQLWDHGLPNAPVYDLVIQPSRRLLRAATHGRSIWERPIDSSSCSPVDVYIRDNIVDTGRVIPSPEGVPHPFEPATVRHWQSPDIKVDASDPGYQTTTAVDDFPTFQADLQHETARRTVDNRFYAQAHNRGPNTAHNVKVRAFFAPTSPGLPPLPADFWSMGRPFVGSFMGGQWMPVGPVQTVPALEAGEAAVVAWTWPIPASAPKHSCLLVVTTSDEDPILGGEMNPDALVKNSKHVGLLNLTVLSPGEVKSEPMMMEMWDPGGGRSDLVLDWGTLPPGSRAALVFGRLPDGASPVDATAKELREHGVSVGPKRNEPFPGRYEVGCEDALAIDARRVYRMAAGKGNETVIPRVHLPAGRPLVVGLYLTLSKTLMGEVRFDVMQRKGSTTVGGVTYVVRSRGDEED